MRKTSLLLLSLTAVGVLSGCSDNGSLIGSNEGIPAATVFAGSEEPNEHNELAVYRDLNAAIIKGTEQELPDEIIITLINSDVEVDVYFHGRLANHLIGVVDDHHIRVAIPTVLKQTQLKVMAASEGKIDIDVFDVENLSFKELQLEAIEGLQSNMDVIEDAARAVPAIKNSAPPGIETSNGIPL